MRAEYIRQLDQELGVIKGESLSGFFLLAREVVEFAKSRGIRHSIRGSAAGSLVAHLLYKCPDPIEHGLLFERFINQGQRVMPDLEDEHTAALDPKSASQVIDLTIHPKGKTHYTYGNTQHATGPCPGKPYHHDASGANYRRYRGK